MLNMIENFGRGLAALGIIAVVVFLIGGAVGYGIVEVKHSGELSNLRSIQTVRQIDRDMAKYDVRNKGAVQTAIVLSDGRLQLLFPQGHQSIISAESFAHYLVPGQKFVDATACGPLEPLPTPTTKPLEKPRLWIDQKPILPQPRGSPSGASGGQL